MRPSKRQILRHLASRPNEVLSARDIGAECAIVLEEVYEHLVELETAGLVRVLTLPHQSGTRQGWEISARGLDHPMVKVVQQ
jgi:predicted ArsR family transcriptional regulator